MRKETINSIKFKQLTKQTKQWKLYTTYRAILNYYYYNHPHYNNPFLKAIKNDDMKTLKNILEHVKTNTIAFKTLTVHNFQKYYLMSHTI